MLVYVKGKYADHWLLCYFQDGRLRLGDRILAVNGTSLVGADYQRYVFRPKPQFTIFALPMIHLVYPPLLPPPPQILFVLTQSVLLRFVLRGSAGILAFPIASLSRSRLPPRTTWSPTAESNDVFEECIWFVVVQCSRSGSQELIYPSWWRSLIFT